MPRDNIVYGYPEDYLLQIFNTEGVLTKKILRNMIRSRSQIADKEERTKDAPPTIKFHLFKFSLRLPPSLSR